MRSRAAGLALALVLLGAAPPALGQPFAFDSGEPIEITADSLEVVQANRVATFSGNVDAVQGDMVLSADELLVHYQSGGGEPAASGSAGAIRRIEARGNVVVTSPRETAEGDVGVYDVAGSLVTLEGSVVLTREENVVRGDRLELDLATGVSRVVSTTTASEGAAPGGRVRAVFVPGDDEPGDDDGSADEEAPPSEPAAASEAVEGEGGRPAAGAATGAPLPQVKPGDDG
ncbi:MAG: LptA/OstA family protein [Geminicoccaceae bacterium]|nr:LptA/OstA family protein [Geminicoccaceae bacterium]